MSSKTDFSTLAQYKRTPNTPFHKRIRDALRVPKLPHGVVAKNRTNPRTGERVPEPQVFAVRRPWLVAPSDMYWRTYNDHTIRLDAYITRKYNKDGAEYNFLTVKYSTAEDKYALDVKFWYIDTVSARLEPVWFVDDNGEMVYQNMDNKPWTDSIYQFLDLHTQHISVAYALNGYTRVSPKLYFIPDERTDESALLERTPNQYREPVQKPNTGEPKKRRVYRTKARIAQAKADGTYEAFMARTLQDARVEREALKATASESPSVTPDLQSEPIAAPTLPDIL